MQGIQNLQSSSFMRPQLTRKFHTNRINNGLRDSLTACRLKVNHIARTLKQQGYRYDRL
jgi:hypothetical protein